jgi:hypothetical protein
MHGHVGDRKGFDVMNAHLRTATDLAAALLGKPRIDQEVRVVTSTYFGGDEPRRVVLVTPAGSDRGEYFTVMNRRTLDLLREGRFSPADLDLELADEGDF